MNPRNARRRVSGKLVLIALLGATACTAPQYDDQTDKDITQLQNDVDTEIVTLISLDQLIKTLSGKTDTASKKALRDAQTKASFDANILFYDRVDVDLITLQTRIDAEPSLATPHLDTRSLRSARICSTATGRCRRRMRTSIPYPKPIFGVCK